MLIYVILFIGLSFGAHAQSFNCPVNIDFETGTLTNWQCYIGKTSISGGANVITVSPSAPVSNRHAIIKKGAAVDPYGKFATTAPDGSKYSVKLGNSDVGAEAERISYTFTIPADQVNFALTYQYAVVFEDPGHASAEQPRFTAKVLDVATGNYITCSSFNYIATSNLPGFKKSAGGPGLKTDVFYKPWSAVTLNLSGYQGKVIAIEFTTADCTVGGHFGYAYVDVNTTCSNVVNGADYCSASGGLVLTGPSGYYSYTWRNADKTQILGGGSQLTLATPPPDGSIIFLDLIPYADYGCLTTVATVIHSHVINLTITDPPACQSATVDITSSSVAKTDDPQATMSYWTDAAASIPLTNPNAIANTGTYYIKAQSIWGCVEIKPVNVVVGNDFSLGFKAAPICGTGLVDITAQGIISGNLNGVTLTYWSDAAATTPLANPDKITTTGTYYVKAVSSGGCVAVIPVTVTFNPAPVLVVNNPPAICPVPGADITQAAVTAGSTSNLTLSYWQDALATVPLQSPNAIGASGTYYIKANNATGCQTIMPVTVSINTPPQLLVTNPPGVCKPGIIDISAATVTNGSTNYNSLTYWKDSLATVPLTNYTAVTDSGQYYIKATNALGCVAIAAVTANIYSQPVLKITDPPRTYIPDKVNLTAPSITNGSSAGLTYTYYTDSTLTTLVKSPEQISTSGTYYMLAKTIYGCAAIAVVHVVIVPRPDIVVPKAFTPTQATNNRLKPFPVALTTFKSFTVYNRWGNLVFQTTDPTVGWDGTYKGVITFMDSYTWYSEGYDELGNLVRRSGNTVILK